MEKTMSRTISILLAGVVLAGVTSLADAQRLERGEGRRPRPASGPDQDRARPLERILKELNLTADQQKQVQQIMDTQAQALRNWRKENLVRLADLHKEIQKARESGDAEKIKSALAEVEKIEQTRKALHENLMKQLKDVLKPDQFEKARKMMLEHPGLQILERLKKELNLTDDQKQKVQSIMEEARKQAEAANDPEQKNSIMAAAMEKIKKDVLTEEQRRRAGRLERAHDLLQVFQKLNLTEEQKAQIQTIMDEAKTQAGKASGEQEKRKIFQQASRKVVETVLTPAQREKLKELSKPKDRPREGRMRPLGKGPPTAGPDNEDNDD
jgi:Spy/CpxP family protein refolding chaperone